MRGQIRKRGKSYSVVVFNGCHKSPPADEGIDADPNDEQYQPPGEFLLLHNERALVKMPEPVSPLTHTHPRQEYQK